MSTGKKSKKIVIDPSGKDLTEFQARHADAWKKIVDSAAYQAGTQFLRNRALERVALLTEEEIEKHGREHLSDLRGFLRHEDDMAKLHEMTDFKVPFEEPEVYLSPEQVEENRRQIEKYQQENQKQRYARS